MKAKTAGALALILAITAVQMAVAEDLCQSKESRDACQLRTGNAANRDAVVDAAKEVKPEVAAQNTGDNQDSTTNDFLPLLRLLLDGDSVSDGQKIGFEWSDPFKFGSDYPNKVTASIQKSDIYEPLKKAMTDAGLTDQSSTLDDQIDAGDDFKIGFAFGIANENYGRDPELHKHLFAGLLESARGSTPKSKELEAAENALGAFMVAHSFDGDTTTFDSVSTSDAKLGAEYKALAEREIRLKNAWLHELAKKLTSVGFDGLVRLIDNQPQLTFSADYHARGDSVGPDEIVATLAWEFGGKSVKTFRDFVKKTCPQRIPDPSEVACLADYLDDPETTKESFRFKLAAAYSAVQKYEFELADPVFSYTEKAVKHLEVSAAASRQIGKAQGKAPRPRFDAKLSYEDFSDDPSRQDRGLATVTFSYPVSQGFFVTLGAIYATKPEFRGDVDEEISARLGFTYKLIEDQ